jgi:beta-lactamase regulating signal transducer with metallopeptidase domain
MTATRMRLRRILWPLAAAVVVAHLGLGVLAAVEYTHFDWLPSMPFEFAAVTAVAASVVLALAGAARVAWPALRGRRAITRLLRSHACALPKAVRAATTRLGIAERIDVVATVDACAITYGLLRPRILLSTSLIAALDDAELTAVLVHERQHLRGRDPLRLFTARVLAGYGWFLPLLGWWADRLALRWELAADRAATASTGAAAVAGALLKLTDLPVPATVAAAHGDLPDRIRQLEGQPPVRRTRRAWWLAGATAANLVGLSAAAVCCTGLGIAMTGGMA